MRAALARAGAAAGALSLVAAASAYAAVPAPTGPAGRAQAGVVTLPKPQGTIPVIGAAFPDRPDRVKTSVVPGRVDDTERIDVRVGPDGRPVSVTLTQHLVLYGTGQYVIRERSSAQDVEALEDTPAPVLRREAVFWQGFVPGRRELAARLTLNPEVEAEFLPVAVTLEWRGEGTIGEGGALPGPGEVVVRLHNKTSRTITVPVGEVDPEHVAGPLDTLRAYANAKKPGPPPAAGRGLPEKLPARVVMPSVETTSVAPLRVTGTITVPGGRPGGLESDAITHVPGGLRLDGVLQGDGEFTVAVDGPTTLALDLTAFPTVDPRGLVPPSGKTWAEWAKGRSLPADRRDAFRQLVEAAAEAARADDYAPYLGHHGPGKVLTTYHLRVAPPGRVKVVEPRLTPRTWPIALAGVALLGIVANGAAIWRRL